MLYENYASTPTESGSTVVDQGSSLDIDFEGIGLVWSRSGLAGGWLYYKSMSVDVLDDIFYETLKLLGINTS